MCLNFPNYTCPTSAAEAVCHSGKSTRSWTRRLGSWLYSIVNRMCTLGTRDLGSDFISDMSCMAMGKSSDLIEPQQKGDCIYYL